MAKITALQLQGFARGCDYTALAPALDRACAEFGIDTDREIRHFLAHVHVETQGLTKFKENLNYSVEGLKATFGRHRISAADCERLGRKRGEGPLPAARQAAIANLVYGGEWGRKNLGNIHPGDGWLYIGRTAIHATGRAAYQRLGKILGVDLEARPELAERVDIGCRAAAAWWAKNGLNDIVKADPDEDAAIAGVEARIRVNEFDDVVQGTRRVNGGANGLEDRKRQLIRAGFIWGG